MPETTHAERQSVIFVDGLAVDGYRMPNGEFRVGIASASLALGYASNWLGRSLSRGGKTANALRGLGFSEKTEKIATQSIRGGGDSSVTIDLRDFNRLIAYAAIDGKKSAIGLQLALTELSLIDFFRDAFGERPLTIEEKRERFYQTYAASISPENWREMDRREIIELALAGDETQARWGLWN